MNTFMDALLPQIHVVKGARKVSLLVPTEDFSAETGMTYLQEVEHDLKIFQRRLDKAMATGVCGQRLELIRRQRDYKRKVFLNLRKKEATK
jgi:hypothetical protein